MVAIPRTDPHRPLPHVDEYLSIGQQAGASDIHLGVNAPPIWRLHGTLQPIWPDAPRFTPEQTSALAEFLTGFAKERNWTNAATPISPTQIISAVFAPASCASGSGSISSFASSTRRCGRWTSSGCPSISNCSRVIRTASSWSPARWAAANRPRWPRSSNK